VARELDDARMVVDDLAVHRPTLEEIYLRLTAEAKTDSKSS